MTFPYMAADWTTQTTKGGSELLEYPVNALFCEDQFMGIDRES
jgi:hypothetical protein